MLEVRAAKPGDAREMGRLHAESWRAAYRGILRDPFLDGDLHAERSRHWKGILEEVGGDDVILVAVSEVGVLGFVSARAHADERWGAAIDHLHVVPTAQGQGIGCRLLAEAATRVDRLAMGSGAFLWVFEANAAARSFYKRLGGTEVGRETLPAPGGGVVDCLRCVWPSCGSLSRCARHAGRAASALYPAREEGGPVDV